MEKPNTTTLTCADCPDTFVVPVRRGPFPTRCPDCKAKARKAIAARSNKAYAEKVKTGGKPCAVDGCPRNAYCKNWCKNHYERWRRYGDVRTDIPLPEEYPTVCVVDGCTKTGTLRLGLCPAHRQRLERTGATGSVELRHFSGLIKPGEVCEVQACTRPMVGRRMCKMHLSRWEKHGRVDAYLASSGSSVDGTCRIKSCTRPAPAGEWCNAHYYGWLEGGGLPPRFQNDVTVCVINGCERPERQLGWCGMHAARWRKFASTFPAVAALQNSRLGPCRIDGCAEPKLARSLCDAHYAQYRKDGQIGMHPRPTLDEIRRRLEDQRERDRLNSAVRRRADPEAFRAKNRNYRLANPARVKVWDQKKRATRLAAARIPYTPEQLMAKFEYWGNRCWMCGGPNEVTEHVKPLSRGGWEALANIRPSCHSCNAKKWATWPYPRLTYGFIRAA